MSFLRKVSAYKHYFLDFYHAQNEAVQLKIEWILKLIETTQHVPEKYFKHIENTKGFYEIRIEYKSNIYRIFAFFDKGQLIILCNAFQKKTNKTPKQAIQKALKIMEEYHREQKSKQ
jgi:phage-related protein